MNKPLYLLCAGALALAACSEAEQSADGAAEAVEAAADSASAPPEGPSGMAEADIAARAAIPANMPKLAYAYGLSFTLPSADVGKLMRQHANVCEQQGPQSCRIVGMDLTGNAEEGDVQGTLQLAVAASHARALSALLENEASDLGAEQTATTIGSEEVSKTIVDTEARIRSREELRDRLTEVLRTRKGSVKNLIEAERQVAEVNEEIDQARSWLAETKGRVAFSRMDIAYASEAGMGASFAEPVKAAFGSLGGIFGVILAGLIMLLAIALPVGGLVAGIAWLRRRLSAPTTAA